MSLETDRRRVLDVYVAAAIAGVIAAWGCEGWLAQTGVATVAATLVVFAGSRLYDNSSVYDPYWSVAPMLFAGFHLLCAPAEASGGRQVLVLALVSLWGLRLTFNWLRGWGGMAHEDWRYSDFRGAWGRWYWPGSLAGIHMFPTLMTWLGSLALHPALRAATPLNLVDLLAFVVTLAAISIEWLADEQMHAYRLSRRGGICDVGLWARSRHPNYFGEIGFWVGLWLFAVAAEPTSAGWTAVGPVAMVVLFRLASIPLADRRSLRRRPGYAEHMRRVPALVPRLRMP